MPSLPNLATMTTVFPPYLHGPLVPYPVEHPGFHPDYGRGGGSFGGPVSWQQHQQGAARHRQPNNPHRPKKTIAKQQQHGAAPSLNQLKHENRKRARRHFKGHYGAATPSTSLLRAPPAPENHNSFLTHASASSLVSPSLPGAAFHVVTPNPFAPGKAWKNSYETIDKEAAELGAAAGIDMLGTNAGLISKADIADEEWDWGDGSDPEDTHGFELHDEATDGSAPATVGGAQRCLRPEEQTAYVSQLEDQNTDLLEENLNLREKVFLLEQELKELRQLHRVSRSASHEEAVCLTEPEDEQQQRQQDGNATAAPAAAAAVAPAATCSQDAEEGHAQPETGSEGS